MTRDKDQNIDGRPPSAVYMIPAAMMFVALADMPYGYYQLLRLVTFVCAGGLAAVAWHYDAKGRAITFGMIALLFNPLIKVGLERETWSVINVITGVFL